MKIAGDGSIRFYDGMTYKSKSIGKGYKAVHLTIHLYVVCLQNPCVAQRVSIGEHFSEMFSAEAGLVSLFTDIAFHIRGAGA